MGVVGLDGPGRVVLGRVEETGGGSGIGEGVGFHWRGSGRQGDGVCAIWIVICPTACMDRVLIASIERFRHYVVLLLVEGQKHSRQWWVCAREERRGGGHERREVAESIATVTIQDAGVWVEWA